MPPAEYAKHLAHAAAVIESRSVTGITYVQVEDGVPTVSITWVGELCRQFAGHQVSVNRASQTTTYRLEVDGVVFRSIDYVAPVQQPAEWTTETLPEVVAS